MEHQQARYAQLSMKRSAALPMSSNVPLSMMKSALSPMRRNVPLFKIGDAQQLTPSNAHLNVNKSVTQ